MRNYTTIGVACLAIIMISTWLWKLVNWAWFTPRKLEKQLRKQGLQGSSYRFLYGDTKDTSKLRNEARQKPIPFTNDYFHRILPFIHQHVNKYGQNSFTWAGPVPVLGITDPELIREMLTRAQEFRKPKLNPLSATLAPGLPRYDGEKWSMHRKIINPAFHVEKLKLMLPAFTASINEMLEKWEGVLLEKAYCEVDVWPYLISLTGDVISRAAFGSSYEEGRTIFKLLKEQTGLTLRLLHQVYIPGWKYMPTKINRRMKQINLEIQTLLKGIIDKRKKAVEAGEPPKNDLLGILMDTNFKETQNLGLNKHHKLVMSFKDMIDECKVFYFAGQETSVLLVWTMILLSKHQYWQTRAREEVVATFGKNQPHYNGLNHLKTVTMILHEVLRLYPPVVYITRRTYDREAKLGNISVPSGTTIALHILQLHQDPKVWGEDAKDFKPERFSEGILKATKGKLSFFPFGGGPRTCIGQNFAIVEAKMALSMMLQRFSFELSPSYTHAPTTIITLQPQYGAHVILHRLKI